MTEFDVYTPEELKKWDTITFTKTHGYCLARPVKYKSLINRIKISWKVFTGEYDAIKWIGQ